MQTGDLQRQPGLTPGLNPEWGTFQKKYRSLPHSAIIATDNSTDTIKSEVVFSSMNKIVLLDFRVLSELAG